jgi:putative addiction module killer protein
MARRLARSQGASPDPRQNSLRAARQFRDCKSVGGGVSEMRFDVGPGYRVYFTRRGETVYLLLVGGDKSTQAMDVRRAQRMAYQLKESDAHKE